MKTRSATFIAFCISGASIGLVCLLQILSNTIPWFDFFKRLEWMSYDWRVRQSFRHADTGSVATNLGVVFIDDDSLARINQAWSYTWPWPRQLYGRLIRKLNDQEAKAIAIDILFQEVHAPSPATDVQLRGGVFMGSDQFFAQQMGQSTNVALAAFGETIGGQWRAIMPADLFRTNAWRVAHATSVQDSDGVLRRARAFLDDPQHGRLWHLGVVMAAKELGLDLANAKVEPYRIVLPGTNGVSRVVPVDKDGLFYINWSLLWNDKRILKSSFEEAAGFMPASQGLTRGEHNPEWKGRLVFVGSIGSGNNISDMGTTPLARETYLLSKHWNVANSIIMDQFIRPPGRALELFLILGMGCFTAVITWRIRAPWPTVILIVTAVVYAGIALAWYLRDRSWLPVVFPLLGGLGLTHVGLGIFQLLAEQKEKRHIKQVFARLVAPEVVRELLEASELNLGGARRSITVLFTDLRGFTAMTDLKQEEAGAEVRSLGLAGAEAKAYFDRRAQEMLSVVNDYLATVADVVKKHKGTLDKYIGDCVMAFWGAPVPNERHALDCVEAAIEAQRAIHQLNERKREQNQHREEENALRASAGQPPLPMLPMLSLGTGINTGEAVVGLMGSEQHLLNYTLFGRDVNLASRLESASGGGRIIISESTHAELAKHKPELAEQCVAQPPGIYKGIRTSIKTYEVMWKTSQPGGANAVGPRFG